MSFRKANVLRRCQLSVTTCVYIYIYHLHNMLSIYTYIHITYITHNLSNIHTSALEYHLIDFWL